MKRVILFLTVPLIAISAVAGYGQGTRRLRAATPSEQKRIDNEYRKKLEAMLLRGEGQHDGSGELRGVGTMESVPALLKVLEMNPGVEPRTQIRIPTGLPGVDDWGTNKDEIPQTKSKKTYICTYAHAVTTLREITGQNFFEYEDWINWWNEYQKRPSTKK